MCVGGAMASRIMKLAVVAVPVSRAARSAPADGSATSLDVDINDDGNLVSFARCFITAGSPLNAKKQVRLNIQVLDTSTVTRVAVGLFNAVAFSCLMQRCLTRPALGGSCASWANPSGDCPTTSVCRRA